MLHGVPLTSIAQYSADEVDWMLDEGCLGYGSGGLLKGFACVPGETCLWRVLDMSSCGRLGREWWLWLRAWRGCCLVRGPGPWSYGMLLGEDRFVSFYHQDGACGLRRG